MKKTALAIAAFLALLAFPFETARAHASLLSSTPANGTRLEKGPVQARFLFSEPIVANLSHVMLRSAGHEIKLEVASDPHEVRAIYSILPRLGEGAYELTWHIISADGHPVSGTVVFAVGNASITPVAHGDGHVEMSDTEPMLAGAALTPAVLRGLALCALLSLCGLLGFSGYGVSSTRHLRICGWLSATATVLLFVHLIVWLVHVSPENNLNQSIIEGALSREVGLNELLRLIFTALAMWAVVLAGRLRLAFAFSLAAVIAGGAIGHSAAIDPIIAIPMKALHLVGVAFWTGGLIWLATADESTDMITTAGTVSSVALMSIVFVGVTGVVQSFLFLTTWSDVVASAYGLTLVGKLAGLIALAAFGAYHRYRLMPSLGSDQRALTRSVTREIAVMMFVIMLGGFLAYVPTPHQP